MSAIDTEQCCKNCRYWEDENYCHRYAPIAIRGESKLNDIAVATKLLLWWSMREWSNEKIADQQLKAYCLDVEEVTEMVMWPRTAAEDWCGDWVVKESK